MRKILVSLAVLAAAGAAKSADLGYDYDADYLRGSDYGAPPPVAVIDWSGVYIGGHGGYTSGAFAQRDAVTSALASYFNATTIESEFGVSKLVALPGSRGRGESYGAFAGYNMQFDDVVVGIEADYTRTNLNTTSKYNIGRTMTTSAGNYETVVLNGQSKTEIQDYGTIRGRAGYAFGNFMPFVTGGFAIAQVRITDTVGVQNYGYDNRAYTANQALTAGSGSPVAVASHGYSSFNPNFPQPSSTPAGAGGQTVPSPSTTLVANDRVKTIGGVALGFGIDYAITPNVMLRGEYQYINFQSFNGHRAELNTIRGGAAVKF